MGDKSISEKAKEKVSEFFLHLMAYGGFTFQDGVMLMWGDPYVFIPETALFKLQRNLEKEIGKKEANEILYYLGKLTGKNATTALIKRYGLNTKNIPEFVNGATQDGFGYFKIRKMDIKSDPMTGQLVSKNCTLADQYLKNKTKSKDSVDTYICGLIAGGTEPLFKNIFVRGKETKCKAKGDKECVFELTSSKNKEGYNFEKRIRTKLEEIDKKSLRLYLHRNQKGSLINRKEFQVKFGDGRFTIEKINGGVMASYLILVLFKILHEILDEKKLDKFVDEFGAAIISGLKGKIPSRKAIGINQLTEDLKILEMLGLGKYEIKVLKKETIIIELKNNQYPEDFKSLFGTSRKPVDILSIKLIKYFLKEYLKREVTVEEVKCKAMGKKVCTIIVKIKEH